MEKHWLRIREHTHLRWKESSIFLDIWRDLEKVEHSAFRSWPSYMSVNRLQWYVPEKESDFVRQNIPEKMAGDLHVPRPNHH